MVQSLAFLVVLWATCGCQAKIYRGLASVDTISSGPKVNVTVVYEMCFYLPPLHVDVKVAPADGSSTLNFTLNVYNIKSTSFQGELVRNDKATGWGAMMITVYWVAFENSLAFNNTPGYDIFYTYQPSLNFTWAGARDFCSVFKNNTDICTQAQVCKDTKVRMVKFTYGPHWVPINDATNDWLQIGEGPDICKTYTGLHGQPTWGNQTGSCSPYNTPYDPCTLKGHIFCCRPSQ